MGPCGKGWSDTGDADADSTAAATEAGSRAGPLVPPVPVPDRADCVYTSHYCEENVLSMCVKLANPAAAAGALLHVVFVSNRSRQVPVWCQLLADNQNEPVLWDYHVLLLALHPRGNWIYDLDSTLPFPSPAGHYMMHAFRSSAPMDDKYRQVFRVVPAGDCLDHFASDRSHMRSRTGVYSAQPPDHPPLRGQLATSNNNMDEWISMDGSTGRGQVFDLRSMEQFVNQPPYRFS